MALPILGTWASAQKLRGSTMPDDSPALYRGLEKAMDERRSRQSLITLRTRPETAVDFSSNDFLSLTSSGMLRQAFLDEITAHPTFQLGSSGSRLMEGNNPYIEAIERELADFHGAETGIIVNSGCEANSAVFTAIPRPCDVIVYDELVHASMHDGMKHTRVTSKVAFRHNDVDSFVDVLRSIRDAHPHIKRGEGTILVAAETVYSMDGDICPLKELVAAAKRIFPFKKTVQFIIDEAHSTGLIGPNGSGLVCQYGMQKEIAIRLHTFGKAIGSTGAVILGNETVRNMLINSARSIIYTTAPSFPMLAAIRAGYALLRNGETQEAQERIQLLVKRFFTALSSNPDFERAQSRKIFSVPLMDGWETRPFLTHIVPIWTEDKYNRFLSFHIQLAGYCAWAIYAPVVPAGMGRVRLVFHAGNTEEEVDALAATVCAWGAEMVDIEDGKTGQNKTPQAAQQVYQYLSTQELNGQRTSQVTRAPLEVAALPANRLVDAAAKA